MVMQKLGLKNTLVGAFSVIIKSSRTFVESSADHPYHGIAPHLEEVSFDDVLPEVHAGRGEGGGGGGLLALCCLGGGRLRGRRRGGVLGHGDLGLSLKWGMYGFECECSQLIPLLILFCCV